MKLITMKKRELLDLCIVLVVATILSIFSISIHTIGSLYSFSSAYTDLPLAEFLINVSFLSLMGLLWITYIRWRKAAKRQAELQNIISSISPDVLLAVDSDRTIIECNDSLKRMFGYEVNEIINHKTDFLYFDWLSSESNSDDWHEIRDMLEREGFHIGLATGKKKNGETIPLEIITGHLSDRGGAVQLLRDITERKRAEEALWESEGRFRRFTSAVTDVIYRYDPRNNQYDFIAPSFELQTGYSLEEIESNPSGVTRGITHPDDADRVFSEVDDHIKKGPGAGPFCTEYRVIRKDGRAIWVSDRKDIEFTPDGKVYRINGIVRDITERKRAEEALRESEGRLRGLFETMAEGVVLIAPDGQILQVNPAAERILGLERSEIEGRNYIGSEWKILRPDGTPMPPEEMAGPRAMKEKRPQKDVVMGVERPDGSISWINVNATPLINGAGKLEGVVGTFADITERKRADEKLRESEEKFRSLAEESPNMIFINKKGRVVYANEKCEEIMGYKRAEFYSSDFDFFKLIAPEFRDLVKENFSRHLESKEVDPLDYALVTKEGKRIEAILNTKLIRYGGESAILGIVTDITERRRAEEKLKQYTRQIEEKNLELEAKNQELTATRAQLVQREKLRALGQMASGVAHNFNNVLAIILGRTQLLQKKAKELEIEKGLMSIERAALDASSTIKRIQDFARVRKDQEFKWVDVNELIEDVTVLTKAKWKDQAEANGIPIVLEVQKDRRRLPPVAGDISELREAFTNIIFNAVEAMPNGGKIVIETQTDRKSVSVSFTDSGTGITDEVKPKIFDPFFTTKGVKNTGLGLSVAYGIIQRHHGDIQIESQQGQGTTVVVRLPVTKILGKEETGKKESEKPPVQRESANILVIEDEEGVRELLFDILTSANHMVKLASGGAEGLGICKKEKFDIIFTDLGMPKMSGWDVAKAIKEIDSNTTVCLITGWGVEMDEDKLKEKGIDRVVTKPVKMEALLTLVSKSIESKNKEKELVEESLKYP